jgi:hypothetical protein
VPDRSRDTKLQVLEIDIAPAKRKQFADSKSGCRVEESQGALPNRQFAEKKLEFHQFEHVKYLLPFRALADELDWVAVKPTRIASRDGRLRSSDFESSLSRLLPA